jgi:hypothetical protein
MHQCDSICLTALQKADGLLARQSNLLEVQDNAASFAFRLNECFQLGYMFFIHPTAQREDNLPVRCSLNPQHLPSLISSVPAGLQHSSSCNHSASRKRLKLGQLTNDAIGEVRQNWRVLYKNAFVDGLLDRPLLFVNIFLNDDQSGCTCSMMFGQLPCGELLPEAQGSSEYPC